MLQVHLVDRVRKALDALEAASELIGVLEKLEQYNLELDKRMADLAQGGSKLGEYATAVHSHLSNLPKLTRSFNSRSIFRTTERVHEALAASLVADARGGENLSHVLSCLDEFANRYDAFITHQAASNAFTLLQSAKRLRAEGEVLAGVLRYFEENLSWADRHDGEGELSIVLGSVGDVAQFAEKLKALQRIYSELCLLLAVSESEHPLRIGKIESGSLWAKVFGEPRVLKLIGDFLEASVQYLHRNYTAEGKIGAVPSKIQSLDAVLELSRRLEEEGVDTSAMKDELGKGAYYLAKELSTLLADQPVIEVNGRIHSLGETFKRSFIESAITPRLRIEPTVDSGELKRLEPPDQGNQ